MRFSLAGNLFVAMTGSTILRRQVLLPLMPGCRLAIWSFPEDPILKKSISLKGFNNTELEFLNRRIVLFQQ